MARPATVAAATRKTPRPQSNRGRTGPVPTVASWLSVSSLLWTIALIALFAQLVVYLAHAAVILPYPFDLDQGEGYDVNAGWLLLQGRPIYTHNESHPYFSSNYPPIYSLAVAAVIPLWGATPLAGRIVSLAATLMLGGLIFAAARERSNSVGGLVAAGLFWTSNYVFHVTPLARVNALAALLATAGLLCVARYRTRWRWVAGLALLLAALFTKPTAMDAALAALAFLWVERPRLAMQAGVVLGAFGLLVTAGLEVGTAGAFSLNVLLGNVNPFIPDQLRTYLLNFGMLHAVPLGLASYSVVEAVRKRRPDVFHIFLLTGGLMALGVGKWGAGESYFLSAIVAASVLGGSASGRLVERGGWAAALLPLLLVGQTLVSAHGAVSARLPGLPDRGLQAADLAAEPTYADLERGHAIVTRLRMGDGPALVEDPSFQLAAGKEIVGNATHLRNLYQAGLWQPNRLVTDVVSKRYHSVILHAELYPEPVLAAVGRHYFLYETVSVYGATQQVFLPGAN